MEYKQYKSYSAPPEQCEECGSMDDLTEPEDQLCYRVEFEDGTVKWVCLKCAGVVYGIQEARDALADLLPRGVAESNYFRHNQGEPIPEGQPWNRLQQLEQEAKNESNNRST